MKKILSILLCLALVASLAVFNVSAKRLNHADFVALQVKEGNCELIDNSETNNLAHNQPIGFYTSSHGTGCNSKGDLVKFPGVKIDKAAVKVAIKGGYNDSSKPGTAVEFKVYLNKVVEGEHIATISISDEETNSSRIADQTIKYADVNVAAGTYDVYIETASDYSGSFSEVAFLYDDIYLAPKWKDDKNCVEFNAETGETEVEEYVKYSYTDENIVYISDNGNDMNDGLTAETPVKTFLMATFKIPEGEVGTFIVTDTVTVGASNLPAGNYYGYDSNSRIELGGSNIRLGGACTFNNIRIRATVDWSAIITNGHKLVMEENVRTEKADGVVQYPEIRTGGHRGPVYEGGEVVLKSGEYHYINATSYQAAFDGNSHVTIYDKVKAKLFIVGSASEEYPQNGTSTFKFVGKSINVGNPETSNPVGLMDSVFIDLTEYEGDKNAVKGTYFANVDCIVLTNPELIPDEARPRSYFETEEDTGDETGDETGDDTSDEMTEEEKKAAEEAAKKAEEERLAAEEAAKKAAEEEAAKKAAEEEAKKKAEEAAKAEEEAKKALEEAKTEEEKAAAEEALKKAEEEKAAAEEAAKKAEEEAKAAEEAAKKAEEEKKAAEEAAKSEEKTDDTKTEDTKTDDEKTDDEKVDNTADEKGGMSPIIWVIIGVVVLAAIVVVVVVASKKKKA